MSIASSKSRAESEARKSSREAEAAREARRKRLLAQSPRERDLRRGATDDWPGEDRLGELPKYVARSVTRERW